MAAMCRARSSKPRTSPGDWEMGRPICQVISSAMAVFLATKASMKRCTAAMRSGSGTRRQDCWAARARFRAAWIWASEASWRST